MKNILVTGGAGYIGCHAVRKLSLAGYNPIIVDNLSQGHRKLVGNNELLVGNVGDANFMDSVFKKHKFEAVMHFAACALVGESMKDPLKYYTNNTASSLNLVSSMLKNGVNKLIYSSTAATYGNPVETPIKESHKTEPINPYGNSKLIFEKMLSDTSKISDLKYVTLRYFNVAGAHESGEIGEIHDPETHIVPLALQAVIENGEFSIFGEDYKTKDGTCIRDYVHVCDLIDAHILAMDYLNKVGECNTFNLGNGEGFSVKEILDAVQKVTDKKLKINKGKRREGDPDILVASSEKIRKELGWKPKYPSIEKIIETAYKWHSK